MSKVYASEELDLVIFVGENLCVPFDYHTGMQCIKDGDTFETLTKREYCTMSILKIPTETELEIPQGFRGRTLDSLIREGTLERVE